jgi:fido (protein-threonine AMPylation protein)
MAIHPFREGNGRSCREFLREFILEKTKSLPIGQHEIDCTRFDGDVVLENIKFSMFFRSQIEMEFLKALVPVEPEEIHEIKM